jgi:hypothetical protein
MLTTFTFELILTNEKTNEHPDLGQVEVVTFKSIIPKFGPKLEGIIRVLPLPYNACSLLIEQVVGSAFPQMV